MLAVQERSSDFRVMSTIDDNVVQCAPKYRSTCMLLAVLEKMNSNSNISPNSNLAIDKVATPH